MPLKAGEPRVWLWLSAGSNDGKCHLWGLRRATSFALDPGAGPVSPARPAPQPVPAAAPQHLRLKSTDGKTYFPSSQLHIGKHTGEDF